MNIGLAITALIFYAGAFGLQMRALRRSESLLSAWVVGCSMVALLTHGWLLHDQIDILAGQNLSYWNMLSMMAWCAGVLVILTLWRMPILNLILFIFPMSGLTILVNLLFPTEYLFNVGNDAWMVLHIFLSIFTVSLLCIAALQAIFLFIQDRLLRGKETQLLQVLPPLMTMEKFLFQTILLGWVALTALILTSILIFGNIFTQDFIITTLMTLFSWLIFTILLIGRYMAGWRGKVAMHFTLAGFVLLFIVYLAAGF